MKRSVLLLKRVLPCMFAKENLKIQKEKKGRFPGPSYKTSGFHQLFVCCLFFNSQGQITDIFLLIFTLIHCGQSAYFAWCRLFCKYWDLFNSAQCGHSDCVHLERVCALLLGRSSTNVNCISWLIASFNLLYF